MTSFISGENHEKFLGHVFICCLSTTFHRNYLSQQQISTITPTTAAMFRIMIITITMRINNNFTQFLSSKNVEKGCRALKMNFLHLH